MYFALEVTFQGQNSVSMGQSVYLTCGIGMINIQYVLDHALFTFFSFFIQWIKIYNSNGYHNTIEQ